MAIGIGTVFGSPMLAPLIGDFVAASYLGWRWTEWISGIMGLATSALILFGLPETHAPTILRRKAAHLRRTTGNNELQSEFDNQSAGLKDIINVFLVKSFSKSSKKPNIEYSSDTSNRNAFYRTYPPMHNHLPVLHLRNCLSDIRLLSDRLP